MKIPSKLDVALYIAIALLLAGTVAVVNHWRMDSGRLKTERTERKAEQIAHADKVSEIEERAAIAIENARKANEVSDHFQKRNAQIEADRAAIPVRTVRMCNRAAPAALPATAESGTAGGHHAAGSGELQEASGRDSQDRWSDDGPDVGPALYALSDEADRCAAQRDALQEWIRNR